MRTTMVCSPVISLFPVANLTHKLQVVYHKVNYKLVSFSLKI